MYFSVEELLRLGGTDYCRVYKIVHHRLGLRLVELILRILNRVDLLRGFQIDKWGPAASWMLHFHVNLG